MGLKVLITGGLGFIGSNLAYRLVGLGAHVTLIDSLIPEYGGNLFNIHNLENQVRVNISDIRDEHSINCLIQGHDVLFNLAGQTSHIDSMKFPQADLEINSRAQLSILEACRQFNPHIRVVFASTRQIYGRPEYLPVNEKHPLSPVDVNGINKLAGEQYHVLYNNVYGISTCVLRLTNTYGPRMRIKDARQTFVGIWLRQLLDNKPFQVWGGAQLRDFTFVEDAIDALLLCASEEKAQGGVFNVGGGATISLKNLAEMLIHIHGKGSYELKEFPSDRKKIDIGDYYSDDTLIRNTLGWQPKVSLEQGLKQTFEFYYKNFNNYL